MGFNSRLSSQFPANGVAWLLGSFNFPNSHCSSGGRRALSKNRKHGVTAATSQNGDIKRGKGGTLAKRNRRTTHVVQVIAGV